MANILAIGNTEAASSSVVVSTTPATVYLISSTGTIPAGALAIVQIQTSGSQWVPVGSLSAGVTAQVINGAGTFRVVRQASSGSFGVDQS